MNEDTECDVCTQYVKVIEQTNITLQQHQVRLSRTHKSLADHKLENHDEGTNETTNKEKVF